MCWICWKYTAGNEIIKKKNQFQKLTQNRFVYDELSLNLEPKVNDIQLSLIFSYSAISTQIDKL